MVRSLMIAAFVAFGASFFAGTGSALAFDQTARSYSQMVEHAEQRRSIAPASYKIVTDESRQPARIDGASRYFGGKVRIVFVDGRAVKMPESQIVENIRSGHFVPVYAQNGTPLNKEDWVVSLPSWLGYATVEAAR